MKKVIAILIALAIACTGAYFIFFQKSDEEKILECLENFETAYASGDLNGCIECFDAKSRNALKGIGTLGSMVGGSVGPFGFNLGSDMFSSLFSLGVAIENEQIKFTVKKIVYTDDNHAKVTADVWTSKDYLYDESTTEETFDMVKENGKWYLVEF